MLLVSARTVGETEQKKLKDLKAVKCRVRSHAPEILAVSENAGLYRDRSKRAGLEVIPPPQLGQRCDTAGRASVRLVRLNNDLELTAATG